MSLGLLDRGSRPKRRPAAGPESPTSSATDRTACAADELLLLTIGQAAERLQVGKRKVEELIADGKLRVCRLGGSVRIRPSDLRRFVASLGS